MNREQIAKWLDKYKVKNYTINSDLTVDVDGDVWLDSGGLTSIPVQFGKVSGSFFCDCNQLTSLEHCPKSVGGSFWCNFNKLTSLEGCPKVIGGNFYCDDNLEKDSRYLRHLLKQKVLDK